MAGIKGIKSGTRSLIQGELNKNKNISKHLKDQLGTLGTKSQKLNLQNL